MEPLLSTPPPELPLPALFEELSEKLRADLRTELRGLFSVSGQSSEMKFSRSDGATFNKRSELSSTAMGRSHGFQPHPWTKHHVRTFNQTELLQADDDEEEMAFWQTMTVRSTKARKDREKRNSRLEESQKSDESQKTKSQSNNPQEVVSSGTGEISFAAVKTESAANNFYQTIGQDQDMEETRIPGHVPTETLPASPSVLDGQVESPKTPASVLKGVPKFNTEKSQTSGKPMSTKAISTRASASAGENERLKNMERAMGVGGDLHKDAEVRGYRAKARKVVGSQLFEKLVAVLILVQATFVGLQVNDMAVTNSLTPSEFFRATDLIFCTCFAVELGLRLFAHGCSFFSRTGWAWNWIDLFLVLAQVIEELLLSSTNELGSGINFSVLRAVRMLRIVRILRVTRLMGFFGDLRRLVACMLFSSQSFLWSSILLFVLIYIYAIYTTQSVHLHRLEVGNLAPGDAELEKWYGSVSKAMLTLFQGLTGGIDWRDMVQPLAEYIHPAWDVATAFWMAFLLLAVMNVITGNFVQNSIELTKKVQSVEHILQARQLFRCLDIDSSGSISTDEIHNHLESKAVKDFFQTIDVDVSEAESLFSILDVSGDGVIDCDEFISGCLRLQGGARAVDLVMMTMDTRRGFEHMASMLTTLMESLMETRVVLASLQP